MDGLPIFDFDNPWVALIQIALFYLLPRFTGLLVDKSTDPKIKIWVLGIAAILTSGLTWLLDVAIAQAWSTVDWRVGVEILVNAAITYAAAQAIFKGQLQPTGKADKDQANTAIQIFDRPKNVSG